MEGLTAFTPLLVSIIAFCATFTALGLLFNILLGPLKKDIAKLEKGQEKIFHILEKLQKTIK